MKRSLSERPTFLLKFVFPPFLCLPIAYVIIKAIDMYRHSPTDGLRFKI